MNDEGHLVGDIKILLHKLVSKNAFLGDKINITSIGDVRSKKLTHSILK